MHATRLIGPELMPEAERTQSINNYHVINLNRPNDKHFIHRSSAAVLSQQATAESHLINAGEVAQEPPQTTVTETFTSSFNKKYKKAESQAQSQLSASGATHSLYYSSNPANTPHPMKVGQKRSQGSVWPSATDSTPFEILRRTHPV